MQKMSPINNIADVSSGLRGLNIGLSMYPYLYVVYESSEGSGESAHMRILI